MLKLSLRIYLIFFYKLLKIFISSKYFLFLLIELYLITIIKSYIILPIFIFILLAILLLLYYWLKKMYLSIILNSLIQLIRYIIGKILFKYSIIILDGLLFFLQKITNNIWQFILLFS